MKTSKGINLCKALFLSTIFLAAMLTNAAAEHDQPPNDIPGCDKHTGVSSSPNGCTTGTGCGWWHPNVGIVWNKTYFCCYVNGSLNNTGIRTYCDYSLNGGCCNNLDEDPHCDPDTAYSCPLQPPPN